MSELSKGQELEKKLIWKEQLVWEKIGEQEKEQIFSLNEKYKTFLDRAKTEREGVEYIVEQAQKAGFRALEEYIAQGQIAPGQKFYSVNRGKMVVLGIMGATPLAEGVHLVGAHLDAPRLDLKPNPLYESEGLGLLKTHYYGGIKKYQWLTIPLAIHGVIVNSQGKKIKIAIGEKDSDPIFTITDLLPHLAKEQMKKTMTEGVTGESLNLLVGSIPYSDEEVKEKVKLALLDQLHREYDLLEEDLISSEIEIVPAGKARDLGLDRSMIGAYGQDDRACAFPSFTAICELEKPQKTALAFFTDKEEIGSMGNTGAKSRFLEYLLARMCLLEKKNTLALEVLNNSQALSADVVAAEDPNYEGVMDKRNAAALGRGVVLTKYTGAGGKYDANDAHAEFVGEIRNLFNEHGVVWQVGELGKVDQGGGGTIAQFLADQGFETLDCGLALLSIHAPLEVASKADIYMAYKAYRTFWEK
ncbi:aminopeptidase [Bacillota bacterium LX-D]|nr:aminopeptidase [Bacillota bacterium LX-D]